MEEDDNATIPIGTSSADEDSKALTDDMDEDIPPNDPKRPDETILIGSSSSSSLSSSSSSSSLSSLSSSNTDKKSVGNQESDEKSLCPQESNKSENTQEIVTQLNKNTSTPPKNKNPPEDPSGATKAPANLPDGQHSGSRGNHQITKEPTGTAGVPPEDAGHGG